MTDISILIPLYNCDNYIDECLDSVVSQFNNETNINWEAIVVNDGSTDESPQKVEKWAEKYSNIILFNKKNEGVSKTRNYALGKASGRYLYFIDPDDKLNYPILAKIVNILDTHNLDILKIGFDLGSREGDNVSDKISNPHSVSKNDLLEEMVSPGQCMLWQYIFRNNIIGSLRFNEKINYMEDYVYLLNAINNSRNNLKIDNSPYFYRFNENSICNSKSKAGILKRHDCYREIINEIIIFKKENSNSLSLNLKKELDARINLMVERYCFNSIFLKRNYKDIKPDLIYFEENNYYPFYHDKVVGDKPYSKLLAKVVSSKIGFKSLLSAYKLLK